MTAPGKLVAIKVLHTVIWVLLSSMVFYLLYAVLADRMDRWFWNGLGLIGLEVAVLLVFRLSCPLTVVARRYSGSTQANFDIHLPEWLARHNRATYTMLMAWSCWAWPTGFSVLEELHPSPDPVRSRTRATPIMI